MALDSCRCLINFAGFNVLHEPPWYGTVCPVVWEDGGRKAPSYPMLFESPGKVFNCNTLFLQ